MEPFSVPFPLSVVHDFELWQHSIGVPWWGTIVVTVLGCKALTLPLAVLARRHAEAKRRLPLLQLEADHKRLVAEAAGRVINHQRFLAIKRELELQRDSQREELLAEQGPEQLLLRFGADFVCYSMLALVYASLLSHPEHGFATGGTLWFADLYGVDPVLTALLLWTHLAQVALFYRSMRGILTEHEAKRLREGRFLCCIPAFLALPLPRAYVLLFLTGSLANVAIALLLRQKGVQARLERLLPAVKPRSQRSASPPKARSPVEHEKRDEDYIN